MGHVYSTNETPDNVVTVVVSRRVKSGCEVEFEKLSTAMSEAATKFQGHLGSNMFRPASTDDPEYRIVFKFRTPADLEKWQNSAERLAYLDNFEELLIEPAKTEVLSGMVTWFTLPGQNPVKPPPKYKMTLVSWLALYPAVSIIFLVFGDLLQPVPLLLRTMIITGFLMPLMSYILMPRFTRWFAFWLYPKKQQSRS
ncbi:antibiotic biosynthesis monooxygenase [Oceanospirillum maris]|uniref:antibiotic biosynthesis monooxygenase n=1 Tax=Oceanospirillum maris TaxID=64977 RepID=UPI0005655F8A|nr:antibiotic biosynthesis monooxygenase [Oceanospirillum maris]